MSALPVTSDDRLIWDAWLAQYRLPVLTVADEVGLFGPLSARALLTEELAAELHLDARALGIHLSALAAMGFVERRELRWRASAAARTWLHPQAEGYQGPLLTGLNFRGNQPLHALLLATLHSGTRPEGMVSAVNEWERGALPAALAKSITALMHAHSRAAARAVAAQPIFAGVRRLLDVGGGSAIFSIELVRSLPRLSATVMEIEAICAEANAYIAAAGAAGRVQTQAVNMFTQDWPRGYDAHFFSNIFHDWSEATCRMLAQQAFTALSAGGTIILHEMLMDDDGCGPYAAAAFSLMMLLGTRGRQYSLPELRKILEGVGFEAVEACSVGSGYYSLVTARKP